MSATHPQTDPVPEVLTIDKPEQLKALGHPLRLRVLETLGESDTPMSNRDLAQKLGVDPGHLHFHVRMLLRAGLIEQVASAKGREKPYRAAAKTLKVAPELVSAGASELQATIVEDVQRGWNAYADEGQFRFVRINARVSPEKALEVLSELVRADHPEIRSQSGKHPGDPGYPRKVFLVHGDPDAQIAMEPKVRSLGFATHVPHWHERVTLD